MRRLDRSPVDPDTTAALDAIDAALAGQPVDAGQDAWAQLARAIVAQRPQMRVEARQSLDQRVERRFAVPSAQRRRHRPAFAAGGIVAALAATIAVVVALSGGGSSGVRSSRNLAIGVASQGAAAERSPAPARAASSAAAAPAPAGVPRPPPSARKVVQSAQLALTVAPNRIADAAQEVFDVVGRQSGIVNSSTVTATGGQNGYAVFQLTVPSAALPQTMNSLSRLRYAAVASRTDATEDVSKQFGDSSRRLIDARTLRTSLLRQLGGAGTQQQIDSLETQIHDADASIASDEATLRVLARQVSYTQIRLTINAGVLPMSHGGSFAIGQAVHDAGRVLTVAAGALLVALAALAALVPVALLGALGWWIVTGLRRRRREQALELS